MKKKSKDKEFEKGITNSLSDALGLGSSLLGFPGLGTQLNQVNTIVCNLRWYLVSNLRNILNEAYVEHGLIQTLCDLPVDDAFRGGVDVFTKQLSEDQIAELKSNFEEENILYGSVGQAEKWKRLFGGAGILIMTDQDPELPLNIEEIKEGSYLKFRAVDMWELYWDQQNIGNDDPAQMITPEDILDEFEFYSYYGQKVHRSRVLRMVGKQAPSLIRPRLRGWGMSIIETLINPLNQYLKGNNVIFEVLDEFKVDVYKINGLATTLQSAEGTEKIKRRVQLANMQKNFQSALTMDTNDEFDHKELSFAGIAETMTGIKQFVASEMRMPLSKIFGISAQGFNSGEDDIENYNSMVESTVRTPAKYIIIKCLKLKCLQLFGFIPSDLSISYKPMREMSAEQEENVKTSKFNRIAVALDKGLISPKEAKESCNKDNLFAIKIETSDSLLVVEGEDEGDDESPGIKENKKSELEAKEAKS